MYQLLFLIGSDQRLKQGCGIALPERGYGFHPGSFEKVRLFGSNPGHPEQVGMIDPLQQH